jgi:aspartate kinase
MFRALADRAINIEMIATSEIRVTRILQRADHKRAVRALHEAFDLDRDPAGD